MGSILLSIGFILAGSSVLSSSVFAQSAPPFTVTFFSLSIALLGLWPFIGKLPWKSLTAGDYGYLFAQGISGILLFRLFLLLSLRSASAWEAGLYMSFSPVFFVILARIILKEPWQWTHLLSLGLVTGSLILFKTGQLSLDSKINWDSLFFLLLAQIVEALMTILRKKQNSNLKGIHHAFLVLASAWIALIIPTIIESTEVLWIPESSMEILALLYYGLLATALAYICWAIGSARVSASTAGILSVLIPLSAQILSILVFKEVLQWYHPVATALALTGVFLTVFQKKGSQSRIQTG